MKFSRKQEQKLIELGMKTIVSEYFSNERASITPWNKGLKTKKEEKTRKWSRSQRSKFIKTMKAKWAKKHLKVA